MLEDPKFVPMARPYASYTPLFLLYIYIYTHVRLASPTDYRTWKQYCKFASHVGCLGRVEAGPSSIGKKIASFTSFIGFGFVPNLQYCFDSRKGWLNDLAICAHFASRELPPRQRIKDASCRYEEYGPPARDSLFALLPPSRARASLFLLGKGEALVREGGFVQCWRTRNSYLWLVRMLLIHHYFYYIYIYIHM